MDLRVIRHRSGMPDSVEITEYVLASEAFAVIERLKDLLARAYCSVYEGDSYAESMERVNSRLADSADEVQK